MANKIEVTIDVIVHATEDITKIFESFDEILGLKEEEFSITETTGHFENPITLLNITITKKQAQNLVEKLVEKLSKIEIDELVDEIEERVIDSRFHMRLDKQELVNGKIKVSEKDTIKLKIHTPIYNKKDTVKIFSDIFQIAN